MNKFYLNVILLLSINFSFAAPVIKSVKTGNWNQASTWNLNRLPQSGDSIVIVADYVVTINNDINLNAASFLKIYGKLNFQYNNSTLSLGDNSYIWVFPGASVMGGGSPSQKLRLKGKTIFDGNDDPVYGPMMASVSSNGFTAMVNNNPIALPVKFVGFTVTLKEKDALVQWSTTGEVNANVYEVERSNDGGSWTTIAYVSAIGNSTATNNYSYTDKNLSGKTVQYRIKEVDVDGAVALTAIQSIKTGAAVATSDIKIASIQKKVLLQFPQQVSGNVVVRFLSAGGQVMDQQSINNPVGQVVLNAKVTGIHIISVSNGGDINTAKQVML